MTRAAGARMRRGVIHLALMLAVGGAVSASRQRGSVLAPGLEAALEVIQAERLRAHITTLASDAFEGRAPGTRGETLTVEYLVDQFTRAGLRPGNPDGTYVQQVPLVGYRTEPRVEITAAGRKTALAFGADYVHDYPALTAAASVRNADIVFAGYGIVAPEYGWDDYRGVDVRRKLVLVLSGEPSRPGPTVPDQPDPAFFGGHARTDYSTRESKFAEATRRGAAGIFVIYDTDASRTYATFQTLAMQEGFALAAPQTSGTMIAGLMTLNAARRVVSLAGRDVNRLAAAAARPGASAVVLPATADLSVTSTIRQVVSRNVVGRVEGTDPRLKDEYVVYSAHWDHLGTDPALAGDQIYNGAIDDAAGVGQLLEVARAFATLTRKPRRSILFIAVTAEEKGYLGSRFYVQHPLFPIAKTVAAINLDSGNVWGPTSDVTSTGHGRSTLDEALAEAARLQGRTFVIDPLDDGGLYFGSDQIEFARAGIPAVFPFSGGLYLGKPKEYGQERWNAYATTDYHQVTDEVRADWNLAGAVEDARWLLIAGYNVAEAPAPPRWKRGSEFQRR